MSVIEYNFSDLDLESAFRLFIIERKKNLSALGLKKVRKDFAEAEQQTIGAVRLILMFNPRGRYLSYHIILYKDRKLSQDPRSTYSIDARGSS